jgi:hypothetical protein
MPVLPENSLKLALIQSGAYQEEHRASRLYPCFFTNPAMYNRLPHSLSLWLSLIILACSSVSAKADDPEAGLQAGVSKVDVTPPIGFAMWGYGARHDAPSVGVMDPLYAKVLVLKVGNESIAIVGLDIGRAPTRQSMAAIRKRVEAETGIKHLFIVGSHTHHGPVIELDNWPTPQSSYVRSLEQKLANVIIEANRALRPAKLGFASKEVPLNRNRHSKRPDKSVDRELLVLRVEGLDGKPIAHAVNFAAHPTRTVAKDMRFSADYPGVMAGVVEGQTNVPCLFLQGAAGDLSPNNVNFDWKPKPFGEALAKEVLGMIKGIHCQESSKPILQTHEADFRFKPRVNLGMVLDDFHFRRQRRCPDHIVAKLSRPTMHQETANVLAAGFLGQQLYVPPKLLKISGCGRALLTFYDDWPFLAVEKQNVEARAILEHALSYFCIWIRHKTVLKMMRVGGNIVRQGLFVFEMRQQANPVRWIIHCGSKLLGSLGSNL